MGIFNTLTPWSNMESTSTSPKKIGGFDINSDLAGSLKSKFTLSNGSEKSNDDIIHFTNDSFITLNGEEYGTGGGFYYLNPIYKYVEGSELKNSGNAESFMLNHFDDPKLAVVWYTCYNNNNAQTAIIHNHYTQNGTSLQKLILNNVNYKRIVYRLPNTNGVTSTGWKKDEAINNVAFDCSNGTLKGQYQKEYVEGNNVKSSVETVGTSYDLQIPKHTNHVTFKSPVKWGVISTTDLQTVRSKDEFPITAFDFMENVSDSSVIEYTANSMIKLDVFGIVYNTNPNSSYKCLFKARVNGNYGYYKITDNLFNNLPSDIRKYWYTKYQAPSQYLSYLNLRVFKYNNELYTQKSAGVLQSIAYNVNADSLAHQVSQSSYLPEWIKKNVPTTAPTTVDLSGYVSKTYLSDQGYVTSSSTVFAKTSHTHEPATESKSGFMSTDQVKKLNQLSTTPQILYGDRTHKTNTDNPWETFNTMGIGNIKLNNIESDQGPNPGFTKLVKDNNKYYGTFDFSPWYDKTGSSQYRFGFSKGGKIGFTYGIDKWEDWQLLATENYVSSYANAYYPNYVAYNNLYNDYKKSLEKIDSLNESISYIINWVNDLHYVETTTPAPQPTPTTPSPTITSGAYLHVINKGINNSYLYKIYKSSDQYTGSSKIAYCDYSNMNFYENISVKIWDTNKEKFIYEAQTYNNDFTLNLTSYVNGTSFNGVAYVGVGITPSNYNTVSSIYSNATYQGLWVISPKYQPYYKVEDNSWSSTNSDDVFTKNALVVHGYPGGSGPENKNSWVIGLAGPILGVNNTTITPSTDTSKYPTGCDNTYFAHYVVNYVPSLSPSNPNGNDRIKLTQRYDITVNEAFNNGIRYLKYDIKLGKNSGVSKLDVGFGKNAGGISPVYGTGDGWVTPEQLNKYITSLNSRLKFTK